MIETTNLNTEDNTNKPKVDVGSIMQGVSGGAGALATAYSTYGNLAKESDLTSRINTMYNPAFRGQEDFNSLESAYMTFSPYSHLTLQDVGFNKGRGIMNVASASMQGAGAGAAFGGWGALIGGVAGLAGGLLGYSAAQNKANKLKNQANSQIDEVNAFNARSLNNRLTNSQLGQFNTLKLNDIYAEGGPLATQGSDWSTGLNYIGAGGSHEQNPNGGIQQGIAPDGLPNLVEEGEVIWNGDYVFSKRLKVPKATRNKYKLRGTKPMSFADAALEFNKEMEERPNDPISKRGRDGMLAKLADVQEEKRAKIAAKEQAQQAAMMDMMGMPQDQMAMQEQPMQDDIMSGANQEELARQEIMQGMQQPMVEGYAAKGGPIGHKYPYAGPLFDTRNVFYNPQYTAAPYYSKYDNLNDENFRRSLITKYINDLSNEDYASLIENIGDKASPYKDDRSGLIDFAYRGEPKEVYNGIWDAYNKSNRKLEPIVSTPTKLPQLATPPINGELQVNFPGSKWSKLKQRFAGYTGNTQSNYPWQGYLRYAPAIGAGLGVFSDLMGWTNKPDYSAADAILNASRGVRDVSFNPIGDYARYRPVDTRFALNALNGAAGATRRGIINTSAGNRGTAMAGILAADNNYMNSIGNTLFTAENANYDRYMKALAHNADINKFNSEGFLKAAMANQGSGEVRAKYAAMAADARQRALQYASAARSANLTNLFDSLGNIGIDALNRADARWLAQYWPGSQGQPSLKRGGKIRKRRRGRVI